jgi:1-(5-phosphoribosyl)-5-[(5-phosphoribosylamino)methylideneamino] imidazole-4-carboxamide isomerase
LGVNRVILGTIAVENEEFLKEMVKKYGDKIAVSVDAKDEKVAVKGWTETVELNSVEFCKKLSNIGVKTIIYTDISKDGMLSGTNLEIYKKLSKVVNSDIIASGGITFLDEIKELNKNHIYGAIVGKAIYSGNLDLKEVLEISK